MNQTLQLPCPVGQVSDGYHTFDELYEHRCLLFIALMKAHPRIAWLSTCHHDGSTYPGWFIAGMDLPNGTITYHLPERLQLEAAATGAKVLNTTPLWDGHTSATVIQRLTKFVRTP